MRQAINQFGEKIMHFHEDTPVAVRNALTEAYINRHHSRVRVWYGDVKTGKSWGDENDVLGYVCRSSGEKKVPLLIYNEACRGGGAVLDHCIVRIDYTDGTMAYSHPTFTSGFEQGRVCPTGSTVEGGKTHPWSVLDSDGQTQARFETEKKARRYLAFMRGERYSK